MCVGGRQVRFKSIFFLVNFKRWISIDPDFKKRLQAGD